MSKKKIAIQGELGAYSHIAAVNLFGDTEIKTCTTFEETFKQAFNDQNYKILIPIIETMWSGYVSIEYKDVAAFSVLIVVLIFFPTGFLGKPDIEKV